MGEEVTLRLEAGAMVAGVVIGPGGQAAVGAEVTLEREAGEEGPADPQRGFMAAMSAMMGQRGNRAETDANGYFEFNPVAPGDYRLTVIGAEGGSAEKGPVRVVSGVDRTGLQVRLEGPAAMSGLVRGPGGSPVAGANVRLMRGTGSSMGDTMMAMSPVAGGRASGSAVSAADGSFTISNVPAGAYTLMVSHSDYARYRDPGLDLEAGRELTGYVVDLQEGGRASGVMLGPDGQPRAGVMIQLMGENGMFFTTTNADGSYSLGGIPQGSYLVNAIDTQAMMRGGAQGLLESAMPSQRVIDVRDGETIDPLAPQGGVPVQGAIAGENLGNFTTVVLREPGAPPFNQLDLMDIGNMVDQARATGGQAFAREDGTFAMEDVPPGAYDLEVYSIDFDPQNPDPSAFMDLDNLEPVYRESVTVGEDGLGGLNVVVP
jgi:hypothetical protein